MSTILVLVENVSIKGLSEALLSFKLRTFSSYFVEGVLSDHTVKVVSSLDDALRFNHTGFITKPGLLSNPDLVNWQVDLPTALTLANLHYRLDYFVAAAAKSTAPKEVQGNKALHLWLAFNGYSNLHQG